ncbi:MAG: type II toxin-antitoxin system VapC family toxin [Gammaproteobacteria bacterium]|nr:type II toxin-antitoxin system VapC family toxin [Gammaproteobacteria bacterium]
MTLRYLLDTNMLSDLIRQPQGTVASRIASVGENAICTSIVVAAELRYGAVKSTSRKIADRVDLVLNALNVLPLESPADRIYARIRQQLTQRGAPIGPNDLLIAAHVLALDLTVVTANEGEFARVPGLKVENWLAT